MTKSAQNPNDKIVFGSKVKGVHKKKYGPKEQKPKPYNGQGR